MKLEKKKKKVVIGKDGVVVSEETKEKKTKTGGVRFGTEIHACTCTHKVQDKLYGNGRRLHNLCKKGKAVRCTICASTKDLK